uniref:Uncharacterized protein n=1 Tax=Arundo donax TaxID=35708 RepID=A0A0A9AGH5_ARUDO
MAILHKTAPTTGSMSSYMQCNLGFHRGERCIYNFYQIVNMFCIPVITDVQCGNGRFYVQKGQRAHQICARRAFLVLRQLARHTSEC